MLGRWVKELDTDDGLAFRGNSNLMQDQEEVKKLKVQVKRLEMEKDILKKTTVFFTADTKRNIRSSTSIMIHVKSASNLEFWVLIV
jgi:transposase-like protein|tara:strand:- start:1118 stop:1375 length:258 start_codon:yes stop_codon:yes gene_type:complete